MRNKMSMSEAGKLGGIASRTTTEKLKQERIEKYYENPKKCMYCENVLEYKNHTQKNFCNQSCSAKFNNKIRGCKTHNRLPSCSFCNGKLKKGGHKYCSNKCMVSFHWKQSKENIEAIGSVTGITQAKRYLKEKNGQKCAICGIDEWMGQPVLLICDHINGNSDDWSLTNLQLLCSNCDAKTPFYKARNIGNGRHSRRQRYKDGKSY